MIVKFIRNVAVDVDEVRSGGAPIDISVKRGDTFHNVEVEKLSSNFSNIHFANQDVFLNVPNDSFTTGTLE